MLKELVYIVTAALDMVNIGKINRILERKERDFSDNLS
jgi:hypothetical protein